MSIFDLYGLTVSSLDDARALIEYVIHKPLKAHESSHHCGAYWRLDLPDGGSLILQKNYDEFENEWTEESFRDVPYLLYVSKYLQADELKSDLCKEIDVVKHLRRSEVV
jgi:hypothetical protein